MLHPGEVAWATAAPRMAFQLSQQSGASRRGHRCSWHVRRGVSVTCPEADARMKVAAVAIGATSLHPGVAIFY
jgi:hypothetical protein